MHEICDFSCITCVDSPSKCTSCNNPGKYYQLIDDSFTCILDSKSPDNYYYNISTFKHERCDISCSTCVDLANKCKFCNNAKDYYPLVDDTTNCKNYPPVGYFFQNLDNVKIYKLCDVSCYTCIDNLLKCTKCADKYFYLEDVQYSCKNYALPNYFLDVSKNLYSRCNIQCDLCIENPNKCTKCTTLAYIFL